jgi:gas vesicle GvpC-like protein
MSLQEQWAEARSRRVAQNLSLLSGSRQQRLEQHRALMAELRQRRQERQEAVRQQREQTRSQLRSLEQNRAAQRALDKHARLEAAAQRAQGVAVLLSRLAQERAAQSQAQRQELETFQADLTAMVKSLLATYAQARQAMANQTRQVRQAFYADLRQRVRQELARIAQEQRAEAQALRQALAAFRRALREQVWGDGIPVRLPEDSGAVEKQFECWDKRPEIAPGEAPQLEATSKSEPPGDTPVAPPPPEPSQDRVAPPLAGEEQPDPILNYVNNYVAALQAQDPNLTLLQVIGDRERVRDLLARGAVDLGVDPSEILATLRRMVSATAVISVPPPSP